MVTVVDIELSCESPAGGYAFFEFPLEVNKIGQGRVVLFFSLCSMVGFRSCHLWWFDGACKNSGKQYHRNHETSQSPWNCQLNHVGFPLGGVCKTTFWNLRRTHGRGRYEYGGFDRIQFIRHGVHSGVG